MNRDVVKEGFLAWRVFILFSGALLRQEGPGHVLEGAERIPLYSPCLHSVCLCEVCRLFKQDMLCSI